LQISRRIALALILATLAVTGSRLGKSMISDLAVILANPENVNWEVAERLRAIGLQPGDKISGLSLAAEVHWARLAGVKIVSEIPFGDANIFWMEDAEAKRKIFQIFDSSGAKMVVTKDAPAGAIKEGWIPLGTTTFYAYRLPPKPD
jgi:hypothetical protein